MNTLAQIAYNLDPALLRWGNVEVRYYGLCWVTGLILGYMLMLYMSKREHFPAQIVDSLAIWGTLAGILGARLGHCFFYDWEYYSQHPDAILRIWEGGLASHGGAIGALIAVAFICRKYKVNILWLLDRLVIPIAILAVLIRIGNFFNSEIYGTPTNLPWGVIFLRNGETLPKHPTQIYEALAYLITFLTLWLLYAKHRSARQRFGLLAGTFFTMVFLARFIIEFIKEDQSPFEASMTLNMGQWLSIPFIVTGLFLIARGLRLPPQPEPHFAPNGSNLQKMNRAQRRRQERSKH